MCGRYGLKTTFATLSKLLRAEPVADTEWGPDFNIAPTDPAPVLMAGPDGARRLDLFRWGLVPFWADDPKVGARMINARADTIQTKPAFRDAFRERRVLVPASGWFEWAAPKALASGEAAKPEPHWFHPPTSAPAAADAESGANDSAESLLFFAGIAAKWRDKASGETRHTYAIVTTDASPLARAVHDRMPVILPPAAQALWLAADAPASELQALLVPYAGPLAEHVVARTVNSVRADGPELIAPLAAAARAAPKTVAPKRKKGQGTLPL